MFEIQLCLKVKFRWQVKQDEPGGSWSDQGPAEVIRFGIGRGIRIDTSAEEPLPRFLSFRKCKDEQKRLIDPATRISAPKAILLPALHQFRLVSSASSAFRQQTSYTLYTARRSISDETCRNTIETSWRSRTYRRWWFRIRWSGGGERAASFNKRIRRYEKSFSSLFGLL